MEIPTKEEWDAWLVHPVTKRVQEWARLEREDFRDRWEQGLLSDDQSQFTHDLLQAKAVGSCQVLRAVQVLEYESIFQAELEEIEQLRLKREQEAEQEKPSHE